MKHLDVDKFEKSVRKRYCKDCNNTNGLKCRVCWIEDMLGEIDDAADEVANDE